MERGRWVREGGHSKLKSLRQAVLSGWRLDERVQWLCIPATLGEWLSLSHMEQQEESLSRR